MDQSPAVTNRPGKELQNSNCSISTTAGSASSGSGCETSPSSGVDTLSLRTTFTKSASFSLSSATRNLTDDASSTSVSSSPSSDPSEMEDDTVLILAYQPVRKSTVPGASNSCRKSFPNTTGIQYRMSVDQVPTTISVASGHIDSLATAKNVRTECSATKPSNAMPMIHTLAISTDLSKSAVSTSGSENKCKSSRPNTAVRTHYNHLENALVFVAMASRLITKTNFCVDQEPYSLFLAEAEDPVLKLQMKRFAERLSESMRCKYPCYVLALIYLDHVSKRCSQNISISLETFQRLVVAAIVVAAKLYDDLYFSNDHYSRELGFPLETLNTLEVCFLILLDFNLRVSASDFKVVLKAFDEMRLEYCMKDGNSVCCGLKTASLPADIASMVAAGYMMSNPSGLPLAFARPHPRKAEIEQYLAIHDIRGHRFDSEEEFLFKSSLMGRCKVIHKLILQYQEEVKKLEEDKLATYRGATSMNREYDKLATYRGATSVNRRPPLMTTPLYNQRRYPNRHYMVSNPPSQTSCVMQQQSLTGWNPAMALPRWKRHV